MDVHAKLAEIRRVVEQARSMPMSASAVVNRGEMLATIDDLAAELDAALSEAQKVIDERDSVIDEGRSQAEQIVADAHNEREKIISDTDVYRVAKREADAVRADASAEAEALRKETDDYVDAKLANFEIALERTTQAVKRGRARLAGSSAFDALATDDVDQIRLPEHLEG